MIHSFVHFETKTTSKKLC